MSPAAHALDRRIYELRSAREAVVASVAALQAEGTWSLLASGLAGDTLTGETASRVRPAAARVTELQQGLDLVAQLVDHVVALRDAGTSDERRTTELVALLNSPAVLVPADVPWMEHVLPPPPGDRAVTAQVLLDEMEGALEPVRRVVADVDAAWQAFLPRLERVSAAADEAAAEAPGNRAVSDVRARLAALSDRVVDDPLGALGQLESLESDLKAAAGLRSEVSRLQSSLSSALSLLDTIESTIAAGARALGQARAEIASPSGLLDPIDPAAISGEQGLRPWFVRLERLVAQGDVTRASEGLSRWNDLAASTLAAAEQVESANTTPLSERSSLLGLLRAARVKAGAAGRAEDLLLASLAESAEAALAVPADLVAAQAHVDAYLEELRRPGAGGPVARPARGSAARAVASVGAVDPWAGVPFGDSAGGDAVAGPLPDTAVAGPDPWAAVDGAPPPDPLPDPASPPGAGSPPDPAVDPWAGVAAGAGSAAGRRRTDLDGRTGDAPGPSPGASTAFDRPGVLDLPTAPPPADPADNRAEALGAAGPGRGPRLPAPDGSGRPHPPTDPPTPTTGAAGGTTGPPRTESPQPRTGSAGAPAPTRADTTAGAMTTSPQAGNPGQGADPATDDEGPQTEAGSSGADRGTFAKEAAGSPAGAHGGNGDRRTESDASGTPTPGAGDTGPGTATPAPGDTSPGTAAPSTSDTRPRTPAPGTSHTNAATTTPGTGETNLGTAAQGGDDTGTGAATTAPSTSDTNPGTAAPSTDDTNPGTTAPSTDDTNPGTAAQAAGDTAGADTAAEGSGATRPGTGAPGSGGAAGGGTGASGGAGRWERPAEPPRRGPADEAGTDVWKEMSA